ncbi:MAG: 4Fe-4S dicluster domain-containing protein [Desulfuromonadales bacterium]
MKDISRRSFLFLTGGSGAAVAVEPGRQLVNKLIPWVAPPDNVRPGEWTFFATTCRECPAGCGMHLWHRDGRVTKAEGNPLHPVNVGRLCARGQSALQGLYDPDRLQGVRQRVNDSLFPATWEAAVETIAGKLKGSKGRVAIISDLQTGALAEVMDSFVRVFGSDRLLFYEAYNYEPLRRAHERLFGRAAIPEYRLEKCDYILSFAADFLETWVSPVGYAAQFADMHAYRDGAMGKLAYVGPRQSMTAANADDFFQTPPGKERWVALAILQTMLEKGTARGPVDTLRRIAEGLEGRKAAARSGLSPEQIERLAGEFSTAKKSVALAGPMAAEGPAAFDTAVAAALLNAAVDGLGEIVDFNRVHALSQAAGDEELRRLASSLTDDDVLILHQSNLVFTRPWLLKDLRRAGTVVYLSAMPFETAEIADWVLPVDSPLEAWGDYEPYSGVHSLLQPTMARLYDTRGAGDIFIALATAAGRPLSRSGEVPAPAQFFEWLQQRWFSLHHQTGPAGDFPGFWRLALQTGGLWLDPPGEKVALRTADDLRFSPVVDPPQEPDRAELWLWPSIYFFDGHLANRAWLQEMPHPVSTIVWGSWLDIHPRKAAAFALSAGDLLEVATTEGSVAAPVRITEEVTEDTVALLIGQGHTAPLLSVARGFGVNPFLLLGGERSEGFFPRVTLKPVGERHPPVYVSATREQNERLLLETVNLSAMRQKPVAENLTLPLPAGYHHLYAPHAHKNHRWAMAIDLHKCIGCHACSVACYAENNIPVLGRAFVERGREMAWLRVPPYRLAENPQKIGWLPLPCQHCDAAPCEPVCPVFAAVHNEEGLNAQIYNRCIGTRYCSNNCPYKVRRFNWFNIEWRKPLELQLNPEVTVRSRGVMEKCTFCVQRIRSAEYQARLEDRPLRDGEVVPACVQTCPAGVFAFGDLLDRESEVYKIFTEHPRRYQVLHELNTKPAVAYLKKIVMDDRSGNQWRN